MKRSKNSSIYWLSIVTMLTLLLPSPLTAQSCPIPNLPPCQPAQPSTSADALIDACTDALTKADDLIKAQEEQITALADQNQVLNEQLLSSQNSAIDIPELLLWVTAAVAVGFSAGITLTIIY